MTDLYDKIKSNQGLLGKIASVIPGFSGYMNRETRRDADKLLRETVANRYGEQLSRISDLQVQLVSNGGIDWVDDLQDAATRLRRFIDMVRTAAYGYGGLFTAVQVKEEDLAKLYQFDAALLENVSKVAAAIDNVEASVGSDGMAAAVRHLSSVMAEANTTYERRKEVLTS
jgi:hypothetical protein